MNNYPVFDLDSNDQDSQVTDHPHPPRAGWTVPELARRYRVSEDKVRAWIRSGELAAINTGSARCGKPRWVVMPEALEHFERGRTAAQPKPAPRRRKKSCEIDFFPD
jgi:excisionase family DNA binding protein